MKEINAVQHAAQKTKQFAEYLSHCTDALDVKLAVQFAAEGAFPAGTGRRVLAGHQTIAKTASEWLELDYQNVFRPCRKAAGSTAEAVEKLMENLDAIRVKQQPREWTLAEVQEHLEQLAGEPETAGKKRVLEIFFTEMGPAEVKTVLTIISKHAGLAGYEASVIVPAISHAFGADPETIESAFRSGGSLSGAALQAFHRTVPDAAAGDADPVALLHTVILYATAGYGSGAGSFHDLTVGIRVSGDERYTEDYIPIGRVKDGLAGKDAAEIGSRIKNLVLETFGTTHLLQPEMVVETEYQRIQINRRTKAGYVLQFPRIRAICRDIKPGEADTLNEVERRYKDRISQE